MSPTQVNPLQHIANPPTWYRLADIDGQTMINNLLREGHEQLEPLTSEWDATEIAVPHVPYAYIRKRRAEIRRRERQRAELIYRELMLRVQPETHGTIRIRNVGSSVLEALINPNFFEVPNASPSLVSPLHILNGRHDSELPCGSPLLEHQQVPMDPELFLTISPERLLKTRPDPHELDAEPITPVRDTFWMRHDRPRVAFDSDGILARLSCLYMMTSCLPLAVALPLPASPTVAPHASQATDDMIATIFAWLLPLFMGIVTPVLAPQIPGLTDAKSTSGIAAYTFSTMMVGAYDENVSRYATSAIQASWLGAATWMYTETTTPEQRNLTHLLRYSLTFVGIYQMLGLSSMGNTQLNPGLALSIPYFAVTLTLTFNATINHWAQGIVGLSIRVMEVCGFKRF